MNSSQESEQTLQEETNGQFQIQSNLKEDNKEIRQNKSINTNYTEIKESSICEIKNPTENFLLVKHKEHFLDQLLKFTKQRQIEMSKVN